MSIHEKRVGHSFTNSSGEVFKILSYRKGKRDMEYLVRFEATGFENYKTWTAIHQGRVRDYLKPSVAGVGYLGKSDDIDPEARKCWSYMLGRCYDTTTKSYHLYEDVEVCESWHDFRNFEKWYQEHYIEGHVLDKDLKDLSSKIYSEDTCTFVPKQINSLVTSRLKSGVTFNKDTGKWKAQISKGLSRSQYLGEYSLKSSAKDRYLKEKLLYITELENKYKDLPKYVFENLIKMTKEAVCP